MIEHRNSLRARQRTLKNTITYLGRGVRTGCKVSMRLLPAAPNTGIRFVRKDIPADQALIPALWNHVVDTQLSAVLGNAYGVRVGTVEHLLAALYGCGVDNVVIEIDAPEVPILDGSVEPYVWLIDRIGSVEQETPRRAIVVHSRLAVCGDDDSSAVLLPHPIPQITMEVDFRHGGLDRQKLSMPLDEKTFVREVVAAHTFGFATDAALRLQGNGYSGSPRYTTLAHGQGTANEEGLHFPGEFLRHQILDTVGDLALAGAPIIGHFCGYKTNHRLNLALLHELFKNREAWSYRDLNTSAPVEVAELRSS